MDDPAFQDLVAATALLTLYIGLILSMFLTPPQTIQRAVAWLRRALQDVFRNQGK
jgi:hypothetical protein